MKDTKKMKYSEEQIYSMMNKDLKKSKMKQMRM